MCGFHVRVPIIKPSDEKVLQAQDSCICFMISVIYEMDACDGISFDCVRLRNQRSTSFTAFNAPHTDGTTIPHAQPFIPVLARRANPRISATASRFRTIPVCIACQLLSVAVCERQACRSSVDCPTGSW